MTVIVGIPHDGRVYLGADSQVTSGYLTEHYHEGKLWSHGAMVFGLTGSPREQQLLQYATAVPELPQPDQLHSWLCTTFVNVIREARKAAGYDERKNDQANVEYGPHAMIGVHGRLFVVMCDYAVLEHPHGTAIGSGATAARGSLHTSAQYIIGVRQRIDLALQAACANDIYCAPPFTYVTSPKCKS